MLKLSLRTLHSEYGATSAEYAIMSSLIAGVIMGAVITLEREARELFIPLLVTLIELTIQISSQPII